MFGKVILTCSCTLKRKIFYFVAFFKYKLNCWENRNTFFCIYIYQILFVSKFIRYFKNDSLVFHLKNLLIKDKMIDASEWIQLEMTNCNSLHSPFSWIFKIKVSAFHKIATRGSGISFRVTSAKI